MDENVLYIHLHKYIIYKPILHFHYDFKDMIVKEGLIFGIVFSHNKFRLWLVVSIWVLTP